MPSTKVKDPFLPVVIIILLAALAAGYYYWIEGRREIPSPAPPAAEVPAPAPAAPPKVRYPIERAEPQEAQKAAPAPAPLPPLRQSDATVRDAAAGLIGSETLERIFNLDHIVRRFVVTVEELPRSRLGQRYHLAKAVPGQFRVSGTDENVFLSRANYRRYAPYVALAEAVDTKKLVALYVHFYPLFQEEYKSLGYPKRYFNDRLVDTIDDLLAAPEVKGPIKLSQPGVMYKFADPALESLSAGQKIMIRMGPANAARIKAKLREIRSEITSVH